MIAYFNAYENKKKNNLEIMRKRKNGIHKIWERENSPRGERAYFDSDSVGEGEKGICWELVNSKWEREGVGGYWSGRGRRKVGRAEVKRVGGGGKKRGGNQHPLKTFLFIFICDSFLKYKYLMIKTPGLLLFLLATTLVIGSAASPCPVPNHPGNLHAGRVIAALNGGVLPIYEGEDSQCYNYALPYPFQTIPEVAVAVHDFEGERSKNIFFFIKPVRSESRQKIEFVVRTQWAYTIWTQLTFSFIAEDRTDLQSGYYQIDSGSLSNCDNGKEIKVLLPFRKNFSFGAPINHILFLHGFEITTIALQAASRSPFELQVTQSTAALIGITVVFSVTTITQVNSIYVSYMAYQDTTLQFISGSYMYDKSLGGVLQHRPSETVPRNYARLFGISGFIMNYNNQKIELATAWDGFSFEFKFGDSANLVQYFSYNYIFFYGSECQDCPGYQLVSDGKCVNFCPANYYKTPENVCMTCGEGRMWNGAECQLSCPQGQFLNQMSNKCECPPSLNWNGDSCISCTNGKVWDANSKACDCPRPLRWNGFACAKLPECDGGKVWDVNTYSCKCLDYQFERAGKCIDIPSCRGGQILNMNYQCVCPQNYVFNGDSCVYTPCIGGQIWTGSNCVCSAGLHFNGSMCIECINGQTWNNAKLVCECDGGYKWNGQFCERTYECTGNRVWSSKEEKCICADRYYWSGYACLPIPTCPTGQSWSQFTQKCLCSSGSKYNGTACVRCQNGEIWSQTTLSCSCPPGTTKSPSGQCTITQQCTGGKTWIQSTWSCECPLSTVFNGHFCIVNPCSNGRVWDDNFKACKCPDNKIWTNQSCVPPQISCTNGRVWNPSIYACECPIGTYPNINKCDPIPVCNNGKVYNPLNNQCNCPFGLIEKGYQCVDPDCPNGQYWNGWECKMINCPPPSYFHIDKCVYGGDNHCPFAHVWNGERCIFYPSSCPMGTSWSGFTCTSTSQCGSGNYLDSAGQCKQFSMQCPPNSAWNGIKCVGTGNACPTGTYAQGDRCLPYVACKNGHIWDASYLRCVCPAGKISNGNACIDCPSQKIWSPAQGCVCPEGSFDAGATCERVTQAKCSIVPNAIWNADQCECRPGFTKIGFQCVCHGTQLGNLCDKCAHKPNSILNAFLDECHCQAGFTEISGFCVPSGQNIGNDDPTKCSVGTFFDRNHKMCLACPDGCLSCSDCYTCKTCKPDFIFDSRTSTCFEQCGDGRKYVHECDDGNNNDGDGCSRDCRIESGYRCTGGNPDAPDQCSSQLPSKITLVQTGQIRKGSSIVLNVKLNYLPNSLLLSQDCNNKCRQILVASITSGDASATSISSEYISGTSYSFAINIEFGRPYIGTFQVKISMNTPVISKYFGSIPIDHLVVKVEPSYLAAITEQEALL